MLANLCPVYRRVRHHDWNGPFYLSASGVFVALAGLYVNAPYASYPEATIIFLGSLLNSLLSGVTPHGPCHGRV